MTAPRVTRLPTAIWGASGHALVVADILEMTGSHEIVGFIDDMNPDRRDSPHGGSRVLGGREVLLRLREEGTTAVALGFGNCAARLRVADYLEQEGFTLTTAIHPSAIVARSASIGAGTVVVAGAIVNPGATVGRAVILNTQSSVDHQCEVGNGAHLSPGARLAGRVRIGTATWIGIGAVVLDGVVVGAHSIVGAGAVVNKNLPDRVVAYGVPARIRKKNGDQ